MPMGTTNQVLMGQFIETSRVHGSLFGISDAVMEKIASERRIPVLCLEIEGAMTLKKTGIKPLYVYCRPPAEEVADNRARVELYEQFASTPGFFDHVAEGGTLEELISSVIPAVSDKLIQARTATWSDDLRRYN